MFPADPHLQFRRGFTSAVHAHLHQFAHAFHVDRHKRISFQNARLQIIFDEFSGVIPAVAESHLRQIIGAETEKISLFSNVFGTQTGPWNFDHGAHFIVEFYIALGQNPLSHTVNVLADQSEFFQGAHQGNHDFRMHLHLFFPPGRRRH